MKKGFTLIELLAVIVILAIIALIATPLILNVIEDSKAKTFDIEATSIEQAAEYYLTSGLKIEDIPKYKEYYIPVTELRSNLKNIKEEMKNEYVVVKKTDNGIKYYYTGREKNPYLKNKTLKEAVESDSSHIRKNVKINGLIVNKVIGTRAEKPNIKNWVWYSGQLWQVLETTDEYVKLVTANSVTGLAYGPNSEWETSWVRKWLNEIDSESNQDGIFYNNLSRTDLLLDGRFCLDEPKNVIEEDFTIGTEARKKVAGFTPINNCEEISTDKIGIMTFEDYIYSLNGINGIAGALGGSYLDEDEYTWTLSKYTGPEGDVSNRIWHTFFYNPSHIEYRNGNTTSDGKQVRPVIYISSKVMIEENNESNYGTIRNPYRLVGEQKFSEGDSLNGVTIGSYIYLSEENNPYELPNNFKENVTSRLNYNYNKTEVRYRVIGIDNVGNIKVQRADVLRGLPNTIAANLDNGIPYYHETNTCDYAIKVYTGCIGHNYFNPTEGSGVFNYNESENIAFYLNNADNSYYNWFSDSVKKNVIVNNWNLAVATFGLDYATILFNNDYPSKYPNQKNDGTVSVKIGLPQWGDMFSGNDLNEGYWYINRLSNANTLVSVSCGIGCASGEETARGFGTRPVFYLKSNIKIKNGEGTPANPYTLSIE